MKDVRKDFEKFIGEIRLLIKLNQLELIPLNFRILIKAIDCVLKHGIYVADAVKLVSAKECDSFLTYDKKLVQIAGERRAENNSIKINIDDVTIIFDLSSFSDPNACYIDSQGLIHGSSKDPDG
ncbi:MAG: hypothetical protein QXX95_07045 [Nitrososphaerales archaeon]